MEAMKAAVALSTSLIVAASEITPLNVTFAATESDPVALSLTEALTDVFPTTLSDPVAVSTMYAKNVKAELVSSVIVAVSRI
jgi:hypothetical protein